MLTPSKLESLIDQVLPIAQLSGLECDHVHFELVDAEDIHALASYHGLPIRYAHWSFGKNYGRLKTAYDYRLSQIYELVINTRPFYAFIDRLNTDAQTLLILAHVFAHVDYFSHSRLFARTPHDILHKASRHARQIGQYRRIYGNEAVESLLDAAMVVADHVGTSLLMARGPGKEASDVLGYIALHSAHLQDWEREILLMIREESKYFWPQRLSKISNEGYATFWHTRLMRQITLSPKVAWEVAELNSKLLATKAPQLNPYALGSQLYNHLYAKKGLGAVFEARNMLDDAGLIRLALDDEVIQTCHLDIYRESDPNGNTPHADPAHIRAQLIQDVEHAGIPLLTVIAEESKPLGPLRIQHHYDGRDLDFYELPFALKAIAHRLWGGVVEIHTMKQGMHHIASHDGTKWADEVS
ncbi:stage V sporulation protein R [Sulfobacillus thermosulfidooxidans DSM 9293]|uniref:Stage V sporulation protein R n=1 Tax=Sulfobacillus thermosulfidooxidans (strain DSM 9293 / VKM B-1269 / AT-1) TaxID=929705 RepID=A0A1W1WMU3_SULTA|nr:SpoVR family protein [Sulfobacillus thermosulfidooxidans]SMC07566.1 stage V sporulation protein R [Sulfobacillus thermosulfidooxidans DSM 9293]